MADQQFLASDTPLQFNTPADIPVDQPDVSQQPASTTRGSGPEGIRTVEKQPRVETQVPSEQPPFVKEVIAKASHDQKQAQHVSQSGDMQTAVAIEEDILQKFASMDTTSTSIPDQQVQPQPTRHDLIAEGEVTLEDPLAQRDGLSSEQSTEHRIEQSAPLISDVQVASGAIPTPLEEPDGKLTMQELHQMRREQRNLDRQEQKITDDPKLITIGLLEGLVDQITQEESQQQEQSIESDSEDRIYQKMEKEALNLILARLTDGKWTTEQDMDAVTSRLGLYGILGLLRDLRVHAHSDTMRHTLQTAIDYFSNEYSQLTTYDAPNNKSA